MQQEKYQQHPIYSVEAPGPILFTTRPQQQPSAQKTSLFFGGGLLLLVGTVFGLFAGNYLAERKVADAQEALKLSELQRAASRRQLEKFCSDSLGGNYGR
jgi:hypothetical protein